MFQIVFCCYSRHDCNVIILVDGWMDVVVELKRRRKKATVLFAKDSCGVGLRAAQIVMEAKVVFFIV